jgi:hypothetical protein
VCPQPTNAFQCRFSHTALRNQDHSSPSGDSENVEVRDRTLPKAIGVCSRNGRLLGMIKVRNSSETLAVLDDQHVQQLVQCRGRGVHWVVEWGTHSVLVDQCRGMKYLATLLANPGREIAAIELASGPGVRNPATVDAQASSRHHLLDDVAKRQYWRRLAEIEADLDEHEGNNDVGRAQTARNEREWLLQELATAAGLSGRIRQFAGAEERARISVGKAIRRAITRITEADPVLGEELRITVQTGLRCCYHPY